MDDRKPMRELVYILIMTLTYPIWKLAMLITDVIFSMHKKLVEWIEREEK